MTKTDAILRAIMGPSRMNLRPLSCAIDIAANLLFVRKVPMDDIMLTKDVYPAVARELEKNPGAIARSVERLSNRCWDTLIQRNLVETYLGTKMKDIRAPGDMLFYLAFYTYLDTPFFEAIRKDPKLLF